MPNEKTLQTKKQLVADLTEKLKNAAAGVLVDYKGINVEQDTKLRRELREAGVHYSVIKNTMLRFAVKEAGLEGLDAVLEGTTALAVSEEDPVAAAKIIAKYAKDMEDAFSIKAGFVDGKMLDVAGVEALAKLPPRDVLVAKALGGLNAPIAGFVNVLNGNLRGLAVALSQIAEKQSA